jgi:hypothetical protein
MDHVLREGYLGEREAAHAPSPAASGIKMPGIAGRCFPGLLIVVLEYLNLKQT